MIQPWVFDGGVGIVQEGWKWNHAWRCEAFQLFWAAAGSHIHNEGASQRVLMHPGTKSIRICTFQSITTGWHQTQLMWKSVKLKAAQVCHDANNPLQDEVLLMLLWMQKRQFRKNQWDSGIFFFLPKHRIINGFWCIWFKFGKMGFHTANSRVANEILHQWRPEGICASEINVLVSCSHIPGMHVQPIYTDRLQIICQSNESKFTWCGCNLSSWMTRKVISLIPQKKEMSWGSEKSERKYGGIE